MPKAAAGGQIKLIVSKLDNYSLPKGAPAILAAGGYLSLLVGFPAYSVSNQSGSCTWSSNGFILTIGPSQLAFIDNDIDYD